MTEVAENKAVNADSVQIISGWLDSLIENKNVRYAFGAPYKWCDDARDKLEAAMVDYKYARIDKNRLREVFLEYKKSHELIFVQKDFVWRFHHELNK